MVYQEFFFVSYNFIQMLGVHLSRHTTLVMALLLVL